MSDRKIKMDRGPMSGPAGGHDMRPAVDKPKDLKASLRKLIRYSKAHLWQMIIALLISASGTALHIMGPDKLKDMTNEILKGLPRLLNGRTVAGSIDLFAVFTIGLTLVFIYAVSAVFNLVQSYLMATVSAKTSKMMRHDVSSKINRLPFKYVDNISVGDLISRVTNDVDTVGQTLNQSLGSAVGSVTMFVGTVIMMFTTNWIMAVTAIVASLLGIGLMLRIMASSQKHFVAQQQGLGNINGHIEEVFTAHHIVNVYNGQKDAKRTFDQQNTALYESGWKSQFMSGLMMPLMQFVGNFGYVAVCVVGAVLTMAGTISFGVIVAFIMYVRLFTQPLSQFAQIVQNLQRTAAANERIFELLEADELTNEDEKTTRLTEVRGDIAFDRVNFSYIEGKTVINDFTAYVNAGQKVAIVGPTGAGKTTIVNLLMRFYELDRGDIRIDGVSISDVPRENVHDQFCMVLQDTWLFEGSINENIIFNKSDVTQAQVVDVCKSVGVDHFIRTLPQGYDTIIDDKTSLSTGQRQLISIARAMVSDAPLLILDEATSSVDTRTERHVQDAMDKLMTGRTSFIIAHRLSTIKNADLILVMRDGDIVESGTHDELLTKHGFYAELYNSQFEVAG